MIVAIIGASKDRSKFGNKAVRAYKSFGSEVVPVNSNEAEIEGLKAYRSVLEYPKRIDVASFYVRPEIGIKIADEIIKKGIRKAYLNPGADSEDIYNKLTGAGVEALRECSIRAIGMSPETL